MIRLSAMGDVALTTGVLDWWGKQRGFRFTVCTRAEWTPLFDGHPAVDEVVAVTREQTKGLAWPVTARKLARQFKGQGLLDLHGVLRSRILAAFWQGPVRRYPKYSLDRRRYLRTGSQAARERLLRHNVPQRYCLALESSAPPRTELLPRIFPTDQEKVEAARVLAEISSPERPLVALHPFATHPDKAWPEERWPQLAQRLEDAGFDWFVLGRGEPLPGLAGHPRDLTNRSNLRLSCALLDAARILVTGDSGPMHLAGGVATPVVALFGPTDPAWGFYPAGPADHVLETDLDCRPCSLHGKRPCTRGRECLAALSVDQVLHSVDTVISNP
ncbi:MAG: glycosyltransferase family 9 protein [Desulfovibrio sp.]|nr:MAG: glycosyltransferase family 9 protein [Desulfovibrio sp.]